MESSSKFKIPKTYSGLMDDVVYRHPIIPQIDNDFFIKSLYKNIFFSGEVLLNDGYLTNHPTTFAQFLDDNSLLRSLITNKHIHVMARSQDPEGFANNPEKMAERGVIRFQEIVSAPEWLEQKKKLRTIMEGLYADNHTQKWPVYDMQEGFRKLFDGRFDKSVYDLGLYFSLTDDEFKRFQDRYRKHPSYQNAARTAVEEVAKKMREEGIITPLAVIHIMNLANQAYHYNFGLCLSVSKNEAFVTDTTMGSAFHDILEYEDVSNKREEYDEGFYRTLSKIPALELPRSLLDLDTKKLTGLFNKSTEIYKSKTEYLESVHTIFSEFKEAGGKNKTKCIEDVEDKAQDYRTKIASFLVEQGVSVSDVYPKTTSVAKIVSLGLSLGLGATFGVPRIDDTLKQIKDIKDDIEDIGKYIGIAGAASALVLSTDIIGKKNKLIGSFVTKAQKIGQVVDESKKILTQKAIENAIKPSPHLVKNGDDIIFLNQIPQFSSLAFHGNAVQKHIEGIPKFGI